MIPETLTARWQEVEPNGFALGEREVHLWMWSLEASEKQRTRYLHLLSEDEKAALFRRRFERDRVARLVARANLRRVLGSYLSISPEEISFSYSPYGRPSLSGEVAYPLSTQFDFNLSHTRTTAIAAVTRKLTAGVDIEDVRPIEISSAKQIFSPEEQLALSSLTPEQSLRAFYRCWTRKEAIAKAEGFGFCMDMTSFSVSLGPTEEPRILAKGSILSREWILRDIPVSSDSVATLAISEPPVRVQRFLLSSPSI
jgi:4'-phosphopantetheinyl transferase